VPKLTDGNFESWTFLVPHCCLSSITSSLDDLPVYGPESRGATRHDPHAVIHNESWHVMGSQVQNLICLVMPKSFGKWDGRRQASHNNSEDMEMKKCLTKICR
jgi:hypothetical protein